MAFPGPNFQKFLGGGPPDPPKARGEKTPPGTPLTVSDFVFRNLATLLDRSTTTIFDFTNSWRENGWQIPSIVRWNSDYGLGGIVLLFFEEL